MGIEPTPSAWEAEVLPLNYSRILHNTLYDDKSKMSSTQLNIYEIFVQIKSTATEK